MPGTLSAPWIECLSRCLPLWISLCVCVLCGILCVMLLHETWSSVCGTGAGAHSFVVFCFGHPPGHNPSSLPSIQTDQKQTGLPCSHMPAQSVSLPAWACQHCINPIFNLRCEAAWFANYNTRHVVVVVIVRQSVMIVFVLSHKTDLACHL